MDVQVCMHTDTLNESGFVEDTIAAFEGRTIHSFHTEGSGGGHAPDIIKVSALPNVLPASTNPTLPYGINSQAELYDMIMVCHHLSPDIPSDVAFAESRIRAETIAAENVLQDMGVISIMSSDSQAMGRVGECWLRTIQTADAMKTGRGKLPEDAPGNDNFRVLRYVAKITINPAIAHGVSHVLGSVEVGKVADLVLWEPAFFGAKPKLVLKGGVITWAVMGDPNASLPTPQPTYYRPMFGAHGAAPVRYQHHVRVAGRARRGCGRQARAAPAGRRRAQHAQDRQARHGAQCRHAEDRGLAGDVCGDRRRQARDRRAGHDGLPQPEIFLQLTVTRDARRAHSGQCGPMRPGRSGSRRRRVDTLALDQWEAQKNRFRKTTAGGFEVAVSLDRGTFLRDGDVLVWDEAARRAVVARISLRDVMVIELRDLLRRRSGDRAAHRVELGHALGNQHWPALVKGSRVFVPLTVDRKVMSSVMNTHRFEGIAYEFVAGQEVIPYLAPHESRRLFGGAEGPIHTHVQDRYVARSTRRPDARTAARHGAGRPAGR